MDPRCRQNSRPQTIRAYVLIETENGKALDATATIAGMDGVITASAVNGPYDVIALTEAADVDDLCQAVMGKIQTVDGITRTLTCPIAHT